MKRLLILAVLGSVAIQGGCSSSYKTQGYAKLSNARDFEEEFSVVWKGINEALSEYKVEEKDQEKGTLKTDWIYSTSNDKYLEYQVNGLPRKRYFQTRYKFEIFAERLPGRVKVTAQQVEEIEKLKSDGGFDGWKSVGEPDSSRASELLRSIDLKILGRHE